MLVIAYWICPDENDMHSKTKPFTHIDANTFVNCTWNKNFFKVGREDQHDKLLDEKLPLDPNFFSVSITGKL